MKAALFLSLLMTLPGWGQAITESALGAGRSATTAAPAKNLGNSMKGIGSSIDKIMKDAGSGTPSGTTTTTTVVRSPAPEAAALTIREDADGIEVGLPYDQLIQRFGKPAIAITLEGEQSLTYKGIAGMYRVTVRNGLVARVAAPPPKDK